MRLLWLVAFSCSAGLPAAQIPLNDHEVIVCYGDSLTEQHLYTAFLEDYCLTRFADKQLTVWNFGWGGDTAYGGGRRYTRDVLPIQPTLVLISFGMNDGGYRAPDDGVKASYLANQRRLIETVRAGEARPLLLTSTPVDPANREPKDVYNTTLDGLAQGLTALGAELGVPVIDQFHPLLTALEAGRKQDKDFTFMRDGVHPDAAGQLVMAYQVIRQLPEPAPSGRVAIIGTSAIGVTGNGTGASVAGVVRDGSGVAFALTLTRIPLWIPHEARAALALVPFEETCNGLYLKVDGLDPQATYRMEVDGAAVGDLLGAELLAGTDLALLDSAPWTQQARLVWDLGQIRWRRHQDAWRGVALVENPEAVAMPEMERLKTDSRALVDALWQRMRAAAAPRTHRVALRRANPVAIARVAVSPVYPMPRDFAATFAPESGGVVAWTATPLAADGGLDLNEVLKKPINCAVYVKVVFTADRATVLSLALGSDDGLIVVVGGQRLLVKDIYRGVTPGEDRIDVPLAAGRDEVLFRVNNGSGGYGLNLRASTLGIAKVTAAQ